VDDDGKLLSVLCSSLPSTRLSQCPMLQFLTSLYMFPLAAIPYLVQWLDESYPFCDYIFLHVFHPFLLPSSTAYSTTWQCIVLADNHPSSIHGLDNSISQGNWCRWRMHWQAKGRSNRVKSQTHHDVKE